MREISTLEAAGHVLCHDLTQIIPGVIKDARFRKGHVVTPEDIPVLLSMGKESLYVWEMTPGMIHEDEAAARLRDLCRSAFLTESQVKEGKIELFSSVEGVLCFDPGVLTALNSLGDLIIAVRSRYSSVKPGEKVAGMRVVPLSVPEELLDRASRIVGEAPLLSVRPYKNKRCALVVTGNEILTGRIEDSFSPVVTSKILEFGGEILGKENVGDDKKEISRAILDFIEAGADLVLCTGGMSVDPDDRTPAGIRGAGAEIVNYGAPVLPGSQFLLSYLNGIPVVGLPGCVMYERRSIFDILLPRLMADVSIGPSDLAVLGNGGLCLNCRICTFPNCGFGKGGF